ncbi:uncharacterized protein LOC106084620 [Stomoxys calcitrans]|uniref:uncharacterized protein LOC106084620 n=1 Tax=Stomoxys calcitrans TaxID=35570 RepID=UPI0027E33A0F|nr:uncharacterized protein LOC106084620 [Stomoxys calcitrans]
MEMDYREEVGDKIKAGVYSLTKPKSGKSLAWKVFSIILKENGRILDGLAYCNMCKNLFKYNGHCTSNLRRHPCFEASYPPKISEENEVLSDSELISQNEEITIKHQLESKIRNGEYKLVNKSNSRSQLWSVFSWFCDGTGTLVKEWVYCRHCKQVKRSYKSVTTHLLRHKCFIKWKREQPAKNSTEEDSDEDKVNEMASGGEDSNANNSMQKFNSGMDSKMEIDERLPSNANHQQDMKEKIKIAFNIRKGTYKLKPLNRKSLIWKTFALIQKPDGSQVEGFVCCHKCGRILKSNGITTGNLNRHKCYIDTKKLPKSSTLQASRPALNMTMADSDNDSQHLSAFEDEEEDNYTFEMSMIQQNVEQQLKSGACTLKANTDCLDNQLWSRFAFIVMDNGAVLRGMVCCRLCQLVLKYNFKTKDEFHLKKHKCCASSQNRLSKNPNNEDLSYCNELQQEVAITNAAQEEEQENIEYQVRAIKEEIIEDSCVVEEETMLNSYCIKEEIDIYPNQYPDPSSDHDAFDNQPLPSEIGDCYELTACLVEENLKKGIFKVVLNALNSRSATSKIFEAIQNAEGNLIPWLRCRQCKKVMKKNAKSTSNLCRHPCYVATKADKNKDDNEEDLQMDGSLQEAKKSKIEAASEQIAQNKLNIKEESQEDVDMEETIDEQWPIEDSQKETSLQNDCLPQEVEEKLKNGSYQLVNKPNGRSAIWHTFSAIKDELGNIIQWVQCRKCKQFLRTIFSTTSNLVRHMCFKQAKENQEIKRKFQPCINFIIEDCCPTSIVEGMGFRKFIEHCLQNGVQQIDNDVEVQDFIPSLQTMAEILEKMANEKRQQVKEIFLDKEQNAAISLDIHFDGYMQKHVLCARLHFATKFRLYDITLGVKLLERPEIYENELQELLKKYDLVDHMEDMVFVSPSDEYFDKALVNCHRLESASHLFSKILQEAFRETQEMLPINELSQKLLRNITCPGVENTYDKFKVLSLNWPKIKQHVEATSSPSSSSNEPTLQIFAGLLDLFKNFDFIFKSLEETRTPSLCFVIPSINRLKAICQALPRDLKEIAALKNCIMQKIDKIWLNTISIWHKAAFFLYPPGRREQHKHFEEIKEFCMEQIKSYPVETQLDKEDAPLIKIENVESKNMTENLAERSEINFFFPNLQLKTVTPQLNIKKEISRYHAESFQFEEKFDVCLWWQNNCHDYPLLSWLALRILSIPASASCAKHILNKNPNLLTSPDADNIIFLNSIKCNGL